MPAPSTSMSAMRISPAARPIGDALTRDAIIFAGRNFLVFQQLAGGDHPLKASSADEEMFAPLRFVAAPLARRCCRQLADRRVVGH